MSEKISLDSSVQIYKKSGTNENSIPNHIASHDKTKYSGTDPSAPRNFAQKLLSAKIKRTFVKIKHPLCSKQDAHKPSP